MNNLQKVFNYQGKQVRTVTVEGSPWFVVKDTCEILDLSNPSEAISRVEKDDLSTTEVIDSMGRKQIANTVSESGLYDLIFLSRKPEAKQFKRWVTHEVLPDIRKHGIYATDNVIDKILNDPDYGIQLLTNYKIEKQKRIEVERTNHILMHVNKTYTATEIAKELGFKSATALNNDLASKKIQFKQNETWVLYSKYSNKGYVDIKQEVLDNGRVIYHRRWTQIGREFLLMLYKKQIA